MELRITDVRALKGDSAFLIDSGKTAVLCDTGFAFTGYRIADNIKAVLGERNLDYIFLTHSHYDHAAATPYIKKRFPKTQVVASEYAQGIFSKPTAKAVMRSLDRKVAQAEGVTEYEDLFDDLSADITVKDGDIIQAGDMCFTCVSLPGHTRCSVGYYLRSKKILVGCETLGVFDGENTVVPSYLIGVKEVLASIDKVRAMDIENILLPHYGLLDKEKTAKYLRLAKESAEDTFREIADLLRQGKSREDCVEYFKNKFYKGYIKTIYPIDAMLLNTGITVDLIAKEIGM